MAKEDNIDNGLEPHYIDDVGFQTNRQTNDYSVVLREIAGTTHKSPSAFDLDFGLTYYGDNFKRSSSLEHVLLHIRRRAATIILVSNLRKYKSTYGMMEMLP